MIESKILQRSLCLVGLIAVTMLGACANGVTTIYGEDHTSPFSPSLVSYVTRTGEMPTVIHGNPFGQGPTDAEAIAASLQSPAWYPPFRFDTRPEPGQSSAAFLVLLFNPVDRTSGGNEVCQAPWAQPLLPGGGPIRLQATLCLGGRYIAHLALIGPPASSPQDPVFRHMMDQALVTLLAPVTSQNSINGSFFFGGYFSE
jgi:hypothetical protein